MNTFNRNHQVRSLFVVAAKCRLRLLEKGESKIENTDLVRESAEKMLNNAYLYPFNSQTVKEWCDRNKNLIDLVLPPTHAKKLEKLLEGQA